MCMLGYSGAGKKMCMLGDSGAEKKTQYVELRPWSYSKIK